MQSPVCGGSWEGQGVLLSAGAPPGPRRQDLRDARLLQQAPEVQPGVRAAQSHREVLLLRWLEPGRGWGELPQQR